MTDSLTISLLRADDLVALRFQFVNLIIDSSQSSPALVRSDRGKPGFVIVEFPPQHIAETAFLQTGPGIPTALTNPPVSSFLAEPSLLVFRVPDVVERLPLTVPDLLAWTEWASNVAPNAAASLPEGNRPGIGPPGPDQTAIEVPYRLV